MQLFLRELRGKFWPERQPSRPGRDLKFETIFRTHVQAIFAIDRKNSRSGPKTASADVFPDTTKPLYLYCLERLLRRRGVGSTVRVVCLCFCQDLVRLRI